MGLRLATGGNLAFSPTRLLAFLLLLSVWAAAQPSLGQVADPAAGNVVDDSANPVMYDANAEWGNFLFRFQYHNRRLRRGGRHGRPGDQQDLALRSHRLLRRRLRPHRRRPFASAHAQRRRRAAVPLHNWLSGDSERIFGANFWYDGTHTTGLNPTDNYYYFQQFGVGLESLGEKWDFRVNANLPVGNTVFAGAVNYHHDLRRAFSRGPNRGVQALRGHDGRGRGRPPHRRQEPVGLRKLLRPRRRRRTSGRREGRPPRILGPRRSGQPVGRQRRDVRHHGDVQHYVVPRLGGARPGGNGPRLHHRPLPRAGPAQRLRRRPDQAGDRHRSRHRRLRNAVVLRSRRQQRRRGRRRNLRASLHHPDAGPNQLRRPETTSTCTETACSPASRSRSRTRRVCSARA